ncbi:transglycosylase SLT domain-containing protein [Lysobacter humi (ex Lee et al. 2017)]
MTDVFDRRRLPLAIMLLLGTCTTAVAASKREAAAVDALASRMQAAETRYSNAMVAAGNGDPAAQREGDAALEDMEDAVNACMKLRDCPVNSMLATYKRLLKRGVDAGGEIEVAGEPVHAHGTLTAAVPEAARAAALLSEEHRFDRMVEFNPAVQHAIRRWLTDMRGSLIASHENYQYMRHLMAPQFERAGLPEALLFGIMAKESNGKVHATSRAGAAGPLQFMPDTGRRFGLGNDGSGFDTRYDPRAAAMASAEYLNERMGELNRNIELALAGYNGGEGRARRVHRENGGRSFWDESVYNEFPAETRDYVPMVIAAAWLYLHPEEYGLTFPKVDAKPASLRLEKPSSIYELTICLGNQGTREGYMRTLRNLNPRYEASTYLPAGTSLAATTKIVGLYGRWCTNGARADLARTLVASQPDRAIVRGTAPVPAQVPMAPPAASEEPTGSDTTSGSGVPVSSRTPSREYRVQSGETLFSISRKFECGIDALARANAIDGPGYRIRPGQALRLEGCRG